MITANADQLVTLLSNYALFIQCLIDMAKYPLRE
jgi:hypothetical protein